MSHPRVEVVTRKLEIPVYHHGDSEESAVQQHPVTAHTGTLVPASNELFAPHRPAAPTTQSVSARALKWVLLAALALVLILVGVLQPAAAAAPYSAAGNVNTTAVDHQALVDALLPFTGCLVLLAVGLASLHLLLKRDQAAQQRLLINAQTRINDGPPGSKSRHDELCSWVPPDALLSALVKKFDSCRLVPESRGSFCTRLGWRDENQDYGLMFDLVTRHASRSVLVCADGLGGHDGGRAASFVAARAIAEAAAKNVKLGTVALMWTLIDAAESAVRDFAKAHFGPDACMTTCLVAIADEHHYHAAWIGDGGVRVRRASGKWIGIMTPQHADDHRCVVTGLIGPSRVNEWQYAVERRQPGDWLLIGSDGAVEGVADWETFFTQTRAWLEAGTPVQQSFADMWAMAQDAMPHIFDDNLTALTLVTPPITSASNRNPAPRSKATLPEVSPSALASV